MPVKPSVFSMIDADWRVRSRSRVAARELHRWQEFCPPLRDLDRLYVLPEWLLGQPPAVVDEVFGVLVDDGGVWARRTELQVLQPGARAIAGDLARLGLGAEETAAVVLSATVRAISAAPRCRAMCAALLLNARRDSWRAARALMAVSVGEWPAGTGEEYEGAAPDRPESPSTELIGVLHQAVEGNVVSRQEAALVVSTRMGRTSVQEVADARRCSVWSVYRDRSRVEASLRRAAGVLA
jgi:hypothetical protein